MESRLLRKSSIASPKAVKLASMAKNRSPLFVVFTTVLVDLIGFGMVIPLVGLYGRHFGASGWELSLLGASYSLMSFVFSPIWGRLSDRIGRRPVMLISLLGSTSSYLFFAYAPNTEWLILSRAFAGLFSGNITVAFAYIADVTTPKDRAKGMGLLGAAFGIGFTLGPPLGGIAGAHWGLAAPGLIAAAICGLNFLLACVRLPESLPLANRGKREGRYLMPLNFGKLAASTRHPELWFLFLCQFFVTFAFSNMEQTFSLLLQHKFGFETGTAGYRTGLILMTSGLVGAIIQGGLIRKLVPQFGERRLMLLGLAFNVVTMLIFPALPTYEMYFGIAILMAFGSGLLNPTLSSLISQSASATEQGATIGVSQSLGALARAVGPFCGLTVFQWNAALPYEISAAVSAALLLMGAFVLLKTRRRAA